MNMTDRNHSYWLRRADEEEKRALEATNPKVADVHSLFAAAYRTQAVNAQNDGGAGPIAV